MSNKQYFGRLHLNHSKITLKSGRSQHRNIAEKYIIKKKHDKGHFLAVVLEAAFLKEIVSYLSPKIHVWKINIKKLKNKTDA